MDRTELVRVLSAMTHDEFSQVCTEARGVNDGDVKAIIVRELNRLEQREHQPNPMTLNDFDGLARRALD